MNITKHTHLRLNRLTNPFDLNHEFKFDQEIKHFVLMHKCKFKK